jgi:hypothetical protein
LRFGNHAGVGISVNSIRRRQVVGQFATATATSDIQNPFAGLNIRQFDKLSTALPDKAMLLLVWINVSLNLTGKITK